MFYFFLFLAALAPSTSAANCGVNQSAVYVPDKTPDVCFKNVKCGFSRSSPNVTSSCMTLLSKPCGEDFMSQFEPNISSCTTAWRCQKGEVQMAAPGSACLSVDPQSKTVIGNETHSSVSFMMVHSLDSYKFVLFESSLPDVLRLAMFAATNVTLADIQVSSWEVQHNAVRATFHFPKVDPLLVPTKDDWTFYFESSILKYEPFSRIDVTHVIGGQLTSHNYWVEKKVQEPQPGVFAPNGQQPGGPVMPIEDSDDRVITILVVCLSVVCLCGLGVVFHWCRHNRYRVSFVDETLDGGADSGVVIGMPNHDGSALLHLVRAKCDWSGMNELKETYVQLKFSKGDIIAAVPIADDQGGQHWMIGERMPNIESKNPNNSADQPDELAAMGIDKKTVAEEKASNFGFFPSNKIEPVPNVRLVEDDDESMLTWETDGHVYWVRVGQNKVLSAKSAMSMDAASAISTCAGSLWGAQHVDSALWKEDELLRLVQSKRDAMDAQS